MISAAINEAYAQLSRSADHRVLRRVPPVEQWQLAEPTGETVRACVVDCEATGLDEADEVIEVACVPFDYDRATGSVVAVHFGRAFTGLRQPSFPIPQESTRIHGITDAMVAGQAVTEDQISAAVYGSQLIIAHNAGYDRPKLERHWPVFEQFCWSCSWAEIDWDAEGIGSQKLDYLLYRMGWFHEGHRALDDALALLFLLSQRLPITGHSALSTMLARARKPLYRVRAENTVFEAKSLLKQRGYSWEPDVEGMPKAWVLNTSDPDGELVWLKSSAAWKSNSWAEVVKVSPMVRYASPERVYGGK